MKEFSYVIKDAQGIHARPAGLLVKLAASYPCEVTITKDGKEVSLKKLLAVMSLAAKCGAEVTIKTNGEKEDEASDAIKSFLEENL